MVPPPPPPSAASRGPIPPSPALPRRDYTPEEDYIPPQSDDDDDDSSYSEDHLSSSSSSSGGDAEPILVGYRRRAFLSQNQASSNDTSTAPRPPTSIAISTAEGEYCGSSGDEGDEVASLHNIHTARKPTRTRVLAGELDALRTRIGDVDHSDPPASNEPSFDELNKNYTPPTGSNLPPVPSFAASVIRKMLRVVWGFHAPREYQIRVIFHLVYRKLGMTYLIRKCGEGKSLVMLGMATLLRGVTVVMVPLLGLGSDQVSKSRNRNNFIEAYHVDEFRQGDFEKLRKRLETYSISDRSSIIVYISPQNLRSKSRWYKTLTTLARQGAISSFCIDEVHATVENSDSFRPEFKSGVKAIQRLISISNAYHPQHKIPLLAMSATFRIPEQKSFNKMIRRFPDLVEWGPMDKRSTGIFTKVAGDPVNEILNDWHDHTIEDPDSQSLLYSNLAKACDESILNRLESKRNGLPKDIRDPEDGVIKEFVPLTGECGIMLKTYLMEAFCGENDLPDVNLPSIWCMPCTSAANCGVSSKRCSKCYRYGLPPNLYDLVQEMGRVNRLLMADPGAHAYFSYLNVPTFLSLWIRAQRQKKAKVRERHEAQLYEVLLFYILPSQCYHETIEQHFENPAEYQSRGGCGNMCSFCTGAYKQFAGTVSKQHLIAALQANIFDRGAVRADKFVTFLTDKANMNKLKKSIWGEKSNVPSGKVHGLVLMLFASKLVELRLSNPELIGKQDIRSKDVQVLLSKNTISDTNGEFEQLAIHDSSKWRGFHFKP